MRTLQPMGTKGSLKWIQKLINEKPQIIDSRLGHNEIEWRSPLSQDDFAEYRDSEFLTVLGLDHLHPALKKFWPRNGPQWDALGRAGQTILLVEAKANIPEISSSCAAKSPRSITTINNAFIATKAFFGVDSKNNWLTGYYQYANRLAHLYFLREICNVDAVLVFIYFCDDPTHIPTSAQEWQDALADQKKAMKLSHLEHVRELFINCNDLK